MAKDLYETIIVCGKKTAKNLDEKLNNGFTIINSVSNGKGTLFTLMRALSKEEKLKNGGIGIEYYVNYEGDSGPAFVRLKAFNHKDLRERVFQKATRYIYEYSVLGYREEKYNVKIEDENDIWGS